MKTKLLSLVVMGLAMMNSACSFSTVGSDQVEASSVHQYYSASYYEDENKTSTYAQFRVNNSYGDTVELLYPSYVLVNNAPMNHDSFLGASYERDLSGFNQNIEFKYTDKEGKVWANQITLYPVSIKTYDAHLNLGNSYQITLDAANMRSGEENEASLCQADASGSVCAYARGASTTLRFSNSEIAKLKTGSAATLKVSRSYTAKAQGPKGGSITATSHTRTVYVQVH